MISAITTDDIKTAVVLLLLASVFIGTIYEIYRND